MVIFDHDWLARQLRKVTYSVTQKSYFWPVVPFFLFRVYCANISLTKGDHLFLNYFQVQSEVKWGHLRSRELILIYEPRGSSRGNMNLLNVFNVTIIWPQSTLFVTIWLWTEWFWIVSPSLMTYINGLTRVFEYDLYWYNMNLPRWHTIRRLKWPHMTSYELRKCVIMLCSWLT